MSHAISSRDLPLIQSILLVSGFIYAMCNLSSTCSIPCSTDASPSSERPSVTLMDTSVLVRKAKKSRLLLAGAIGVVLVVTLCLLAPVIAPWDPEAGSLADRFLPPQWFSEGLQGHILGTDQLGRDVLSRVLVGGGTSMTIAVLVIVGAMSIGIVLGLTAGYFGKGIDATIMRFVDIMMALPTLIIALCFMAVLGPSIQNLVLVLVLTSWVLTARVVRGSALAVRNSDYVSAARVIGASHSRIIARETLPNVVPPILIMASQQFGIILMTEASLSFLGMGVPAPAPSWGSMIAQGQAYIGTAPWVVVAPGVMLMITVLAFNLLGDGTRDVLDSRSAT